VAVVRDGKANLVVVQLGERTSDKVEILSGLLAGDTIVLTGLMQVKQGMKVKIIKVSS
jgi:membrane fusion protein (multidrug efflux system)